MPGVKTKICIKPEDKYVSARIMNEGAWEGSTVSLVLKAVSKYPDAVFLDLGSNIGMIMNTRVFNFKLSDTFTTKNKTSFRAECKMQNLSFIDWLEVG